MNKFRIIIYECGGILKKAGIAPVLTITVVCAAVVFGIIFLGASAKKHAGINPRSAAAKPAGKINSFKKYDAAERKTITVAFYVTWQAAGLDSFRANASKITYIMPEWLHLSSDGKGLDFFSWGPEFAPSNKEVIEIARKNRVKVEPILNNAANGKFDPGRAHELLSNPEFQSALAAQLKKWLVENRFKGINIDFENLGSADIPLLPQFLSRLKAEFKNSNLEVSADIEPKNVEAALKKISPYCSFVVLMAYDEHYLSGAAGPIASMGWYAEILGKALKEINPGKLVAGIASYGYDWAESGPVKGLTFRQALLIAKDNSSDPNLPCNISFDPIALNPTFNYKDAAGNAHNVWFLDAVTAANELKLVRQAKLKGAALWVLGSEDPSIWACLDKYRRDKPLDTGIITDINFPGGIKLPGNANKLNIEPAPLSARRTIETDAHSGFYSNETYINLPSASLIAGQAEESTEKTKS